MMEHHQPCRFLDCIHIILDSRFKIEIKAFLDKKFGRHEMDELLECIRSQDLIKQHKGVIGVRKILFEQTNPQDYKYVAHSGIVPRIVQLLRQDQYLHLKMEAMQLISRIASHHTRVLSDVGLISDLLKLINHKQSLIQVYALQTLSKFLKEGGDGRKKVLEKNGGRILLNKLKNSHEKGEQVQEQIFNTLSQICINQTVTYNEIKDILLYFIECFLKQKIRKRQSFGRIYSAFSYQGILKREVYNLFANNKNILRNLVEFLKQSLSSKFIFSNKKYFIDLMNLIDIFTLYYEDFMPKLLEFDILRVGVGIIETKDQSFRAKWYKIMISYSMHQSSLLTLTTHHILSLILFQMKFGDGYDLHFIFYLITNILSHEDTESVYAFLKFRQVFTILVVVLEGRYGTTCELILELLSLGLRIQSQYRRQLKYQTTQLLLVRQNQLKPLKAILDLLIINQNENIFCQACQIQQLLANQL